MTDSNRAIKRPSVAALYAFVAVLLALMFVVEPARTVDPSATVLPPPFELSLPECSP